MTALDKSLVGKRVRALFFDAGWYDGLVIDDPDNGPMLDPDTQFPHDEGFISPLSAACDVVEMRVTVKERRYMGFLNGHRVFIDGVKYPRERSSYYTTMDPQTAIQQALDDYHNRPQ